MGRAGRAALNRTSKCRSCGADIHWCVTTNGKTKPVDVEPHADGTLKVEYDERLGEALVTVAGTSEEETRHRSHFATCPDAKKWRK